MLLLLLLLVAAVGAATATATSAPFAPGPRAGLQLLDAGDTLVAHHHDREQLGRYTGRQLMLFYRYALQRERRQRAARIADINAALVGGRQATALLKALGADEH